MRTVALIIFIATIFGYVLSDDNTSPLITSRIIGGEDTIISEVPYQLSLFELQDFLCGASIIGSKWAITAAHCVLNKRGDLIKYLNVGAGNEARNKAAPYIDVSKVIKHPKYNKKTLDNDIALLEINGTFPFSDKVKPVKIASAEPAPGTSVVVSGWGVTVDQEKPKPVNPEILQKVTVKIIDRKICKKQHSKLRTVTDSMICAGDERGGKDACHQDSGGPLVANNILYGIVSWGYGCGRIGYPGVYTNVAKYESWIKKNAII